MLDLEMSRTGFQLHVCFPNCPWPVDKTNAITILRCCDRRRGGVQTMLVGLRAVEKARLPLPASQLAPLNRCQKRLPEVSPQS